MNVIVNGFEMAYTDVGRGIPLLLVHGYPLNRQMWQPQIDGLKQYVRILAPDLRGHGDSQAVPGPYSMDLFADDLAAFLDALRIDEPVVLCGLSMGGYIAFAFYRKYAHRLRGLILAATRAIPDSPEARQGREAAALLARQRGIAVIAEGMAPRLLSPKTLQSRPELVQRVREIMLHSSLEGVLGDLDGLKDRPDSSPTLAQINLPTLVIAGADDQLIPLEETEAMRNAIAHSQMVVIPDAGHLLNLEQPQVFNAAVRDFLSQFQPNLSS
jgi:pimeloyl-ACP methyl ester carboxylesterase